jgi:23S rRNA G2445 N2-methylase RlmL
MAPLLADEIADAAWAGACERGFDGRSDVVLFDAESSQRRGALGLRLAEDLFVEIGRASRADGDDPRRIASRIWTPANVERTLSVWSELASGLRATMTFRVIARVRHERSFRRTDLRSELVRAIGADRPRWRVEDPARLEVWLVEYSPGQFVAGLRVSDARLRQHDGRELQRAGALRPTLAAAMVRQAGQRPGVLLDPCCGSGTILAEAIAAGWTAQGTDVDADAVQIAAYNVPGAQVQIGDVRRIEVPDGDIDACVSNLPFGRQFEVQGDLAGWLRAALAEMVRVTRSGGRIVVLSPVVPDTGVRGVRQTYGQQFRLLGTPTRLWCFDRI